MNDDQHAFSMQPMKSPKPNLTKIIQSCKRSFVVAIAMFFSILVLEEAVFCTDSEMAQFLLLPMGHNFGMLGGNNRG